MNTPESAEEPGGDQGFYEDPMKPASHAMLRKGSAAQEATVDARFLEKTRRNLAALAYELKIPDARDADIDTLHAEVDAKEREISDRLPLGTTVNHYQWGAHIVTSKDFTKDRAGARTVELFPRHSQQYRRVPLYDFLRTVWTIDSYAVLWDTKELPPDKSKDLQAFFQAKFWELLRDTTVDAVFINSKVNALVKRMKTRKSPCSEEQMMEIVEKEVDKMRQNRK